MHLKSFLLLAVFALLTLTVAAAPVVKRGPPSIKFCDYSGSERWGRCVVEIIEWGVCKPVPDSNNMGDTGSTWEYIDGSDTMVCRFYRSDTDCTDWIPKVAAQGEKWGQFPGHMIAGFKGSSKDYYRNYACHDWMSEVGPELPPLPSEAEMRDG